MAAKQKFRSLPTSIDDYPDVHARRKCKLCGEYALTHIQPVCTRFTLYEKIKNVCRHYYCNLLKKLKIWPYSNPKDFQPRWNKCGDSQVEGCIEKDVVSKKENWLSILSPNFDNLRIIRYVPRLSVNN